MTFSSEGRRGVIEHESSISIGAHNGLRIWNSKGELLATIPPDAEKFMELAYDLQTVAREIRAVKTQQGAKP